MTSTLDGKERSPYSRCGVCKHFKGWKEKTGWANGIEVCDAFPDGIPDDIWEGKNNHDESYPGDNGITFESKD
ncbi:MAG: hypothetical protein JXQ82_07770 [Methanomicrobiaceae archaeon]|nr:hypothetical protein [Methanomicrobiaceae archaeon]